MNLHDALMYGIDDPQFPGKQNFCTSEWLLDHPAVLNARYEDMVGQLSPGSTTQHTLDRIRDHIGGEPMEISPYSSKSPTFRQGAINGWMNDWNMRHHLKYAELHTKVLERYGYKGMEE